MRLIRGRLVEARLRGKADITRASLNVSARLSQITETNEAEWEKLVRSPETGSRCTGMSAIGGKADIARTRHNVRL